MSDTSHKAMKTKYNNNDRDMTLIKQNVLMTLGVFYELGKF